jgi:hypothetical protein
MDPFRLLALVTVIAIGISYQLLAISVERLRDCIVAVS